MPCIVDNWNLFGFNSGIKSDNYHIIATKSIDNIYVEILEESLTSCYKVRVNNDIMDIEFINFSNALHFGDKVFETLRIENLKEYLKDLKNKYSGKPDNIDCLGANI